MSDAHLNVDTTRPRLHVTAESGWVNDPLGLTYRDGRYHLFFQYVPGQVEWRPNCHWGHATSDDLLHWTEQEVALAPGDGDDGCWSGSIVTRPQGEPALFYTTVTRDNPQIGRVRVAHPRDPDWNAWDKGEVLAALPEGIDAVAYRDPFVFHDGDRWRMLMGAGLADGTATALVHSSGDLRAWTFDGELAGRHTGESDPMWTGRVWECPQLFPMGDKWVLTVSVWEPLVLHYEAYAVGSYADGRFTAEHWGRLTYGPAYYAGSTFTDAEARRGLIYWLRGVADEAGRWTGANSIPHLLTRTAGSSPPSRTRTLRHCGSRARTCWAEMPWPSPPLPTSTGRCHRGRAEPAWSSRLSRVRRCSAFVKLAGACTPAPPTASGRCHWAGGRCGSSSTDPWPRSLQHRAAWRCRCGMPERWR